MNPCVSCFDAEANPATHSFSNGCTECSARALAHGQDFFLASRDRQIKGTPYGKALGVVFGKDKEAIAAGHARVVDWAARIKEARAVA